MTENYMLSYSELLKEYWMQAYRNHLALLNYEDINSTDYIKNDVFTEVENQSSI